MIQSGLLIPELLLMDLQWLQENCMLQTGQEDILYRLIKKLQEFHGDSQGLTIKQAVATREGSVTVIDPETGKIIKELVVGSASE